MASNACLSALAAIEDVQILHYYALEVLTMAKRILISSLLLKVDKVDVEEFLKNTFKSKKQIILAPYYGGTSYSLEDIPFVALEQICVREMANSLYSLALEYNEFIDKINFINYLLENLGRGSHNIALQRLKDKLGGKKGMSSRKKEADKIIKKA